MKPACCASTGASTPVAHATPTCKPQSPGDDAMACERAVLNKLLPYIGVGFEHGF